MGCKSLGGREDKELLRTSIFFVKLEAKGVGPSRELEGMKSIWIAVMDKTDQGYIYK